ncbi:hypothetical protein [Herbaspirillum rhizosphaerae]|uniref:hypothetical protein n=1 Tax=Herbaspirillum rhizosphaerae TaxID=346179 RepID=UPI000A736394|nr:hypothetical protein [Herbaspirillum rhizosphaerae]
MLDVQAETCLAAWRSAAAQLLQKRDHHAFNLILEITNPCHLDLAWLTSYSPDSIGANTEKLSDVIDTIFPITIREKFIDRNQFYSEYLRRHRRAMKWTRNRGRWGTYFERLIAFDKANSVNQLERVIEKLNSWEQRNTTGLVFHLSSPTLDAPRVRGGPCWHFGEIVWNPGGVLDLVVVYRNHDYFNKALGNFLALGQLLKFIADASNKIPGKLICHSVHAYFDRPVQELTALARLNLVE